MYPHPENMQLKKLIKPQPQFYLQSKTNTTSTLKFLFVSMATLFSLALLSILLFFSISSTSANRHHSGPRFKGPAAVPQATPLEIQQACKATRFSDQCEISLIDSGRVPPDPSPIQIIQSALSVSADSIKKAQPIVRSILDAPGGDSNRTEAANRCLDLLHDCDYRTTLTAGALQGGRIKDGRAWMSACVAYHYDCWNGLSYVNGTKLVNDVMVSVNSSMITASNALSMIWAYDIFGNQLGSWAPPKTERDGFWEKVDDSGSEFTGGIPADLKAKVTVCKGGGIQCQYKTVQEAVNAAPDNPGTERFVILIKSGVYEETVRVPLEKRNVVFLGEGMGKTVITGSLTVPTTSTYNSATVGVLGDGFMAKDLTIQNTAGPDTHQAVALRLDSDLSILENCELLGNQDTLYAHTLRQYYNSCMIQGSVDFIFGNAAAFFHNCTILIRPRQMNPEKGESNAVTAHGRTDPAQSTGFVFQNCLINGTDKYVELYKSKPKVHRNYLGRPWKEYSRTVFINNYFEAIISPEGWLPWKQDFALKTLYYGEFQNRGPGANLSGRVNWSSQIPAEHANFYTVQNFIQGNEWIGQ